MLDPLVASTTANRGSSNALDPWSSLLSERPTILDMCLTLGQPELIDLSCASGTQRFYGIA